VSGGRRANASGKIITPPQKDNDGYPPLKKLFLKVVLDI